MIKKKLRDTILLVLEKTIDGYMRFDDLTNNPGFYAYYDGWSYPLKKSALSQALKRLREKGFIERQKDEDKIILRLTELGKDWLLKNKVDSDIQWDGVWRLVIFDIPESRKRARNTLRRRLKDWGFNPWQKSVWATKKPLTEIIRKLIKDLEIEDWVLVIESSNTGK
jgi:phenylacetic acid degradation operon negative regulatory protein